MSDRMSDKHAYLIMIHENTLVLKRLLMLLDNDDNDIYIHVDRRAKKIDLNEIRSWVKTSKVTFTRRYRVNWGTDSITKAEMSMLKEAVPYNYRYYHLLSGADLPIKSQDEIHDFFDRNDGKDFIHFGTEAYQRDTICRYNVYHFFTKQLGRKRDKKLWCDAETYSLAIQRRLHIDRTKKCKMTFYAGANWVSITNNFAQFAVKEYKKYRKHFRFVQISDELIWQTMIMNSPYKDNLYLTGFKNDYSACVRYIDWDRGNPYVFRIDDYDALMKSDCMFARKFDEKIDKEIIEKIYLTLKD